MWVHLRCCFRVTPIIGDARIYWALAGIQCPNPHQSGLIRTDQRPHLGLEDAEMQDVSEPIVSDARNSGR
jgi:hypothetical protein